MSGNPSVACTIPIRTLVVPTINVVGPYVVEHALGDPDPILPYAIRNEGRSGGSINIGAHGSMGWPLTPGFLYTSLPAHRDTILPVTVGVPTWAQPGDRDTIWVSATRTSKPSDRDEAYAVLKIVQGTGVEESPLPGSVVLHQNVPNPFSPATEVSFVLGSDGPARVEIYDVSGRFVRSLLNEDDLAAGEHRVTWDGKNYRGLGLPSGIYFCRLAAGAAVQTRKIVLAK